MLDLNTVALRVFHIDKFYNLSCLIYLVYNYLPSDVNAGVDIICRCVYFSHQTITFRHTIRPFLR